MPLYKYTIKGIMADEWIMCHVFTLFPHIEVMQMDFVASDRMVEV